MAPALLLLSVLPPSLAGPPLGTSASRNLPEDTPWELTVPDFGFIDPLDAPADAFLGVQLTTVPQAGRLQIDGRAARDGSVWMADSRPGGVWQSRSPRNDWAQIACSGDGSTVVAAVHEGSIHLSRDGGHTWTEPLLAGGPQVWVGVAVSLDGSRIVVAPFENQFQYSEDGGQTWTSRGPLFRCNGLAASSDGVRLAAISQLGPILVSSDAGVTWTTTAYTNGWTGIDASADGVRLLATGTGGAILSTDGGATWNNVPIDFPPGVQPWLSAPAVSLDGRKMAAFGANLWTSADGGETWKSAGQLERKSPLEWSPDGRLLAATNTETGRSLMLFEAGDTWLKSPEIELGAHAMAFSANGQHLWAAPWSGSLQYSSASPSRLEFIPAPHQSGSPYTQWQFQVLDAGPPGQNMDPDPKSIVVHVTSVPDPPGLASPLPPQIAATSELFRYPIGSEHLVDPDPGSVLAYSASRSDGSPLPPWLVFNAATRTFSGTPAPPDAGTTLLKVTATDETGRTGNGTFTVTVAGRPRGGGGTVTTIEETSHRFDPSSFHFSDPLESSPHPFTGVRVASLPALGSLTLNGYPVAEGDVIPWIPTHGISWLPRSTLQSGRLAGSSTLDRLISVGHDPAGSPGSISTDHGRTWNPIAWFATRGISPDLVAAGNDGIHWVVADAEAGFIYTSADAGQTWTPRGSAGNWLALACSADGSRILALEGPTGSIIVSSDDFGATWTKIPHGFLFGRTWRAAAGSAEGMTWLLGAEADLNFNEGSVLRSQDGGTTWEVVLAPRAHCHSLACSSDGRHIILGTDKGLHLSDDTGTTWRHLPRFAGITGVAATPDGQSFVATAENGAVHFSRDRGQTWVSGNLPAVATSLVLAADTSALLATTPNGLFSSQPAVPDFVFTPPSNGVGAPYTQFTYHVQDGGPLGLNLDPESRPLEIHVTNTNDPPETRGTLPAQTIKPSADYAFAVPANIFLDPDPGDTLSLRAEMADGQALPAWLFFNAASRTFHAAAGTLQPGVYGIRVVARDQGMPGLEAEAHFALTVSHSPPRGSDAVFTLAEDSRHEFTPADFGFADADSPPNQFTRFLLDTVPAAGRLTIDGIPLGAGEYVSMVPDAQMLWTQSQANCPWTSLALSDDGLHLAAACVGIINGIQTGEIRLSADGGQTWTTHLPGPAWSAIALSADGRTVVAAAPAQRLAISRDRGATWASVGEAGDWRHVSLSADGSSILAAPSLGQPSLSRDGGTTWIQPQGLFAQWKSLSQSADGSVLAALGSWDAWISNNRGESWTFASDMDYASTILVTRDGTRLFSSHQDRMISSSDGGTTWSAHGPLQYWRHFVGSHDGSRLLATSTTSARLFVSTDFGQTWTPKENEHQWTALASSATGDRLVAATEDGRLYTSVATVPRLVYESAADGVGTPLASFRFRVEDNGIGGDHVSVTTSTISFNVHPVDDAPRLAHELDVVQVSENAPLAYTLPANAFIDPDPDQTLSYAVRLADGSPLPSWLSFDPATRTLAGTPGPPDTGEYRLHVMATDNGIPPLSVSAPLFLYALNVFNPPVGTPAERTVLEDTSYTFSASDFGFSDPGDAPPGHFHSLRISTFPTSGMVKLNGDPVTKVGTSARLLPSAPGLEWESTTTPPSLNHLCSSADGLRLAAARTGGQIFTSQDGGNSWTARSSTGQWAGIACSENGLKLVTADRHARIHLSQDGGVTWQQSAAERSWRAVASSGDGSVLAAAASSQFGTHNDHVYFSTDAGASWHARGPIASWVDLACSADGRHWVAASEYDGLYISNDQGASWSTYNPTATYWQSVTCSADGRTLTALTQHGVLFVSQDGGLTWGKRVSNHHWRSLASSADGSHLLAVTTANALQYSHNAGLNWVARGGATLVPLALALSADGARMFVTSNSQTAALSRVLPPDVLVFEPAKDRSGGPPSSFRFQVRDDGDTAANLDPSPRTFAINVLSVNDSPAFDPIPNPPPLGADGRTLILSLTGISAGGGESQNLAFTAVSSAPEIIPHPTIAYVNPNTFGALTYTPVTDAAGRVVITVTLKDDGGTTNGGVDTFRRQVTVSLMTRFERHASKYGLPTDPAASGSRHFFDYAYGLEPWASNSPQSIKISNGTIERRGQPALIVSPSAPVESRLLFGLRKNAGLSAVTEFSADLTSWETSLTNPAVVAEDNGVTAFSIAFPVQLSNGRPPRFCRLKVISP